MAFKRKTLTQKELEEVVNIDSSNNEEMNELEELLRSWGFDPTREIFWNDDPVTKTRRMIQEVDDV